MRSLSMVKSGGRLTFIIFMSVFVLKRFICVFYSSALKGDDGADIDFINETVIQKIIILFQTFINEIF